MSGIPKDGHLPCAAYLEVIRQFPCYGCGHPPPNSAHHWPLRARGVTNDTKVIPLCVPCHARAHGTTVTCPKTGARLLPVGKNTQNIAVDAVLRRFVEECSVEDWERFSKAIVKWKKRPAAEQIADEQENWEHG